MNLLRGPELSHGDSNVGDEGEWVWQHYEVATSLPAVELLLCVFQMIPDQTGPAFLGYENWKEDVDDFSNGETG